MTPETLNNLRMTPVHDDILARLMNQLQQLAGKKVQITEDLDIVTQLGLDSVKVLDLIMEVEDEFDVSIPMNMLTEVHTVGDLANAISGLLAKK